ncbi:MAG: HK97 family phage prohead protease [Hyphomicrobiaceae bacterium]|nr:HK97 family phage prohead protease [Hyphomicrobiaceae bacterium]
MHHPTEAVFTALDLKSIADDGLFEGYASLFNREDLGHDVIAPGAFRDTLAAKGAAGVRLLFQHKPDEPIGVWEEIAEDAKGLRARGRLATEVPRAREVLALMRAGAIDGLSIGFRALKARRDKARGIRLIEKVDLWEISIVTFPMLPGARIRNVKHRPFASAPPTERQLERWLTQDAGLTRTAARALLRHGHKGLASTRDAAAAPDPEALLASRVRRLAAFLCS